MNRTFLLAAVHIARKELRLDEPDYRDILRRCVKKHSAGDCTDAQLRSVLDEFKRLGWIKKPGKAAARKPLSPRSEVRLVYAIWGDIRPLLEADAADAELRGFVRRQTVSPGHPDGIAAVEFCDHTQIVKVIEGLKGWRARLQRNHAKGVQVTA